MLIQQIPVREQGLRGKLMWQLDPSLLFPKRKQFFLSEPATPRRQRLGTGNIVFLNSVPIALLRLQPYKSLGIVKDRNLHVPL